MESQNRKGPSVLLRYSIAMVFMVYGFAKITGAQFIAIESELDRPMRDVSGFWLTWYYFGYSAWYRVVIALGEIVGAFLLTFRRTTLLGALMLFGMTVNIMLINIFFAISVGTIIVTALLLWGLVTILSSYRTELLALFLPPQSRRESVRASRGAATWALRLAMLASAAVFQYWTLNHNVRSPTSIDGTWRVEPADGTTEGTGLRMVYFEPERAYWAAFAYDDSLVRHHFEVTPETGRINIWNTWLQKDSLLYSGTLTSDSTANLVSEPADSGSNVLRLRKVR